MPSLLLVLLFVWIAIDEMFEEKPFNDDSAY